MILGPQPSWMVRLAGVGVRHGGPNCLGPWSVSSAAAVNSLVTAVTTSRQNGAVLGKSLKRDSVRAG
jgi:hypothetical protein